MTTKDDGTLRGFETGATRDTAEGKLDFEGFYSPVVMEQFARFMNMNRLQSDGKLRDSDNWQKGIPMDVYMKSGFRHFFEWWAEHRSVTTCRADQIKIVAAICGLLFNAQGYLHELLKEIPLVEFDLDEPTDEMAARQAKIVEEQEPLHYRGDTCPMCDKLPEDEFHVLGCTYYMDKPKEVQSHEFRKAFSEAKMEEEECCMDCCEPIDKCSCEDLTDSCVYCGSETCDVSDGSCIECDKGSPACDFCHGGNCPPDRPQIFGLVNPVDMGELENKVDAVSIHTCDCGNCWFNTLAEDQHPCDCCEGFSNFSRIL